MSRVDLREITRRLLVAAARDRFQQHGYVETRVQDIASDAGYTRGAFYANFEDKGDIFLAVLEADRGSRLATIDRLGDPGTADPIAAALAWIDDTFVHDPLLRARAEFGLTVADHAHHRPRLTAIVETQLTAIEHVIEAACAHQGVRLRWPAGHVARLVACLFGGYADHRQIDEHLVPPELITSGLTALWTAAAVPDGTD